MDIALVQQFLPDSPVDAFQQGLNAIKDAANAGADLVVFPELSFTPFYPQVPAESREEDVLELAEPVPGPTTGSVADMAETYGVVVVFNQLEQDGDTTYNTSPVIDADGTLLGCTRMMHVPDYELFHEQGYYAPGNTGAPVYDTAVGRLGVAICYDRHFPEYMRALALQDAEIVAVPQAGIAGEWAKGIYQSEVQVASFQHGYFTAMANRIGPEEEVVFNGNSLVTDPFGRIVAEAPSGESILLMASIDRSKCEDAPARTLFLKHRRPDEYEEGSVALSRSEPVHENVDEAEVSTDEASAQETSDEEASDGEEREEEELEGTEE